MQLYLLTFIFGCLLQLQIPIKVNFECSLYFLVCTIYRHVCLIRGGGQIEICDILSGGLGFVTELRVTQISLGLEG